MIQPVSAAHLSITAAVLGMLFGSACGSAPEEATITSDPEPLTGTCASKVAENTYDGPNFWGTMSIKNTGSSAWSGFAVSFDVPSGAHCTNDAVPSGAKLGPLKGSGTSATTQSNHCTFTFTASLAAGATKTFNYSTD